jgi:hypothetical protein
MWQMIDPLYGSVKVFEVFDAIPGHGLFAAVHYSGF